MKKVSYIFWGAAGLLFVVMCVVVIFYYNKMKSGIGNSAPPSVAFLYAIPFAVAIIICVILAVIIGKKR